MMLTLTVSPWRKGKGTVLSNPIISGDQIRNDVDALSELQGEHCGRLELVSRIQAGSFPSGEARYGLG